MATRVRVRAAALGLSTVLGLSAALSTVSTAWSPVARAGYHDAPSGGAMGGHGSTGAAPSAPATTATVEVTLSEFRIEPARLQVPANVPIVLRLRNTGQVPHNLEVEAAGKEYELAANLSPGGTADLTLPALPPGEYPLYCPVGNHAALGMKGVLVVSAAPAGPMGGGSAPRARFHVGQRQVLLDGRTVPLDVPVHIFQGGDAWVGIRAVVEAFGGQVAWDPVARVVTVSVGGHTARLPVGATTAVVDGQSMPLSAPLHIVNGRTQVPLPLLAQLLNLRLEWVQEGQEAILR